MQWRLTGTTLFLIGAICALLFIGFWPHSAQSVSRAASAVEPVRPTVTPIPRSTLTLIPGGTPVVTPVTTRDITPSAKKGRKGSDETGAHIVLYVDGGKPHRGEYWTQVQWQGADGGWHNVDGWKGFTTNGVARWFVAPSHFGRGPFRWIVSDELGNQELAVSNQFYLPQHPAESVITKVGACCHGDLSRSVLLGQ